jgi:TolA-binding protein
MALVNGGKLQEALAEFEAYLKLAPDGQFAATAKGIIASIKK